MVAIPSQPVTGDCDDEPAHAVARRRPASRDYPSVAIPVDPDRATRIFVGPKDRELLARIGNEFGTDFEALIDYGMFSFMIRPVMPVIGRGARRAGAGFFITTAGA